MKENNNSFTKKAKNLKIPLLDFDTNSIISFKRKKKPKDQKVTVQSNFVEISINESASNNLVAITQNQNLNDGCNNDDNSDFSADVATPALDAPEQFNVDDSDMAVTPKTEKHSPAARNLSNSDSFHRLTEYNCPNQCLDVILSHTENSKIDKDSMSDIQFQSPKNSSKNSSDLLDLYKKVEVISKKDCETFLAFISNLKAQVEKEINERQKLEEKTFKKNI